jgi:hypothetical protein
MAVVDSDTTQRDLILQIMDTECKEWVQELRNEQEAVVMWQLLLGVELEVVGQKVCESANTINLT